MARQRVGVVIPTRNRRAMLEQTLRSVLSQREVDVEPVVIDEASEDDTPTYLRREHGGRIEVVRHETPRGTSAARNAGLGRVAAPWVAFVDDDDLWAPDKLRKQLEAIRTTPGSRWCAVGDVKVDMSLTVRREKRPPPPGDVSREVLVSNAIPGGGSGVLAETALVRDVGGFDEQLKAAEDLDLWIRLSLRSPLASVDEPLIAYRVHEASWFGSADPWAQAFPILQERYREAARERGVAFDVTRRRRRLGNRHLRAGARRLASAEYRTAWAASRNPRMLALALGSTLAPRLVVAVQERGWRRRRPAVSKWAAAAEQWLAPYRTATDDT